MKHIILSLCILQVSCQSTPNGQVNLGYERPSGECREIGQVIGTSNSRKDSREKAMADLRHEAANHQANYVRVLTVSAHGGAVRGIAYRCQ